MTTQRSIVIINESSVTTDAQLAIIVAACQIQISRDFAPAWGTDAKLRTAGPGRSPTVGDGAALPPQPDEWQIVITDTSDEAGNLGHHDVTAEGLPIGKVFAKSDLEAGSTVSASLSHELLEMLADPDLSRLVEVQKGSRHFVYSLEVCDPCEDDKFNYEIEVRNAAPVAVIADPAAEKANNARLAKLGLRLSTDRLSTFVAVSNFIYPRWFHNYRRNNVGAPTVKAPPEFKSGSPIEENVSRETSNALIVPPALRFDHAGHMKGPFEVLEGGFISYSEVVLQWQDAQMPRKKIDSLAAFALSGEPDSVPLPYRARPRVGSRRERRRTLREQWQRSERDQEPDG